MVTHQCRVMKLVCLCIFAALAAGRPALAQSPILPGLYNTGVAANDSLLPYGAQDTFYALTASADPNFPGPASFVVNQAYPVGNPWVPDGPASEWIAPRANQNDAGGNGGDPPGNYVYQTTFNLSAGINAKSLVISGEWTTDDWGTDILVNGHSTGNTAGTLNGGPGSGAFGSFVPFTLDNYFVSGQNTLDFLVTNGPNGASINPTGLNVVFESAQFSASTPEPNLTSFLASSCIGAAALLLRKRRR